MPLDIEAKLLFFNPDTWLIISREPIVCIKDICIVTTRTGYPHGLRLLKRLISLEFGEQRIDTDRAPFQRVLWFFYLYYVYQRHETSL